MAITKTIDTDLGVPASYWRLTHIAEDFEAGIIDATVHGWVSAEAHAADNAALAVRRIRLTVADLAGAGVELDITALLEPVLTGLLA